ncbi:hypothetical protein VTI74DRAFT_8662 [Chaetomium olivicolor]
MLMLVHELGQRAAQGTFEMWQHRATLSNTEAQDLEQHGSAIGDIKQTHGRHTHTRNLQEATRGLVAAAKAPSKVGRRQHGGMEWVPSSPRSAPASCSLLSSLLHLFGGLPAPAAWRMGSTVSTAHTTFEPGFHLHLPAHVSHPLVGTTFKRHPPFYLPEDYFPTATGVMLPRQIASPNPSPTARSMGFSLPHPPTPGQCYRLAPHQRFVAPEPRACSLQENDSGAGDQARAKMQCQP